MIFSDMAFQKWVLDSTTESFPGVYFKSNALETLYQGVCCPHGCEQCDHFFLKNYHSVINQTIEWGLQLISCDLSTNTIPILCKFSYKMRIERTEVKAFRQYEDAMSYLQVNAFLNFLLR